MGAGPHTRVRLWGNLIGVVPATTQNQPHNHTPKHKRTNHLPTNPRPDLLSYIPTYLLSLFRCCCAVLFWCCAAFLCCACAAACLCCVPLCLACLPCLPIARLAPHALPAALLPDSRALLCSSLPTHARAPLRRLPHCVVCCSPMVLPCAASIASSCPRRTRCAGRSCFVAVSEMPGGVNVKGPSPVYRGCNSREAPYFRF